MHTESLIANRVGWAYKGVSCGLIADLMFKLIGYQRDWAVNIRLEPAKRVALKPNR